MYPHQFYCSSDECGATFAFAEDAIEHEENQCPYDGTIYSYGD